MRYLARQRDDDLRADVGRARDHRAALVHVDDRASDGQAEPGSARALLRPARAAIEAVEDVLELGRVDTHAIVTDGEAGTLRGRFYGDIDMTPGGRELDGIADEIAEHLAQARRVVRLYDRLPRKVHAHADATALSPGLGMLHGVLRHGAQVVVAQLQGHE